MLKQQNAYTASCLNSRMLNTANMSSYHSLCIFCESEDQPPLSDVCRWNVWWRRLSWSPATCGNIPPECQRTKPSTPTTPTSPQHIQHLRTEIACRSAKCQWKLSTKTKILWQYSTTCQCTKPSTPTPLRRDRLQKCQVPVQIVHKKYNFVAIFHHMPMHKTFNTNIFAQR